MKRDWKLIRMILIKAENDVDFDDLFKEKVIVNTYHLLQDAGYVQGYETDTRSRRLRLTWKGHDLLEYLGNGLVIEELEQMGQPITEYTLKKYAEFLMEKYLFEYDEFVD
jgi:actin-related protein